MTQRVRTSSQLGAAISNERRRQGLTQQSLSRLTGVGQKTISHVETGKGGVKLETLFVLLAALGLELHVALRTPANDQKIDEIF